MTFTDMAIIPSADYQAACNVIREKTGKTELIKSGDMANEIASLALPEEPAISISVGGLITATSNDLSTTKQLPTSNGGTFTPKSTPQTVASALTLLLDDVKIAGNSNLIASNIKKGVNIFGVTGTAETVSYITLTIVNNTAQSGSVLYLALGASQPTLYTLNANSQYTATFVSGGSLVVNLPWQYSNYQMITGGWMTSFSGTPGYTGHSVVCMPYATTTSGVFYIN